MWFAYMDEAGNTGRNLNDSGQPIHLILTVALDETKVMDLHEHVREVAERHLPSASRRPDFEFHGHALFAGSGDYTGMAPAKRIEIYDELLQVIGLVNAKVIVRGVYKPGLARRYAMPLSVTSSATKQSVRRGVGTPSRSTM